jgi:hypothetical protein
VKVTLMLVVGLAVLSGCGGGDAKSAKAEYLSNVRLICEKANTGVKRLGSASFRRQAPRLFVIVDHQLDEMKKLTPRPELKPDADRYIADLKQARSLLLDLIVAMKTDDAPTFLKRAGLLVRAADKAGRDGTRLVPACAE